MNILDSLTSINKVSIVALIVAIIFLVYEFYAYRKTKKKKGAPTIPPFSLQADKKSPINTPIINPPIAPPPPMSPTQPSIVLPKIQPIQQAPQASMGPPTKEVPKIKAKFNFKPALLIGTGVLMISAIALVSVRLSQQGTRNEPVNPQKTRAQEVPTTIPTAEPTQALLAAVSPTASPSPTLTPSPTIAPSPTLTASTDSATTGQGGGTEITQATEPSQVTSLPKTGLTQFSILLFAVASFVIFISFLY